MEGKMGLHFGSRGPQVLEIQKQLNDYYRDPPLLAENSVYDFPTKQKVMRFQADQALVPDGDAGDITLTLLRGDSMKIQVVPDPPTHIQADNQWICWASSLSSFMEATKDIVQFND